MESNGVKSLNHGVDTNSTITIKGILSLLMQSVGGDDDGKRVISLGMGDPSAHSCFSTTQHVLDSVSDSLMSSKFNGYAPTPGLPQARRSFSHFPFDFLLVMCV